MVLSLSELRKAESESENKKIVSMLRLRENTSNFLIQCLADREIQKLICHEQGGTNNSSAYRYNCTVVHTPHAWSHFSAINGHGWNANSNQPHDPNLKVGKVLANQHANHVQNSNSKTNHNKIELEENNRKIFQLEETIQILKEENSKIKQVYLARVSSTDKNSNDSDNQQQLNSLRQQIKTISSNLEEKIKTIKSLNTVNEVLRIDFSHQTIRSEDTIRILKEENARLMQNFNRNLNDPDNQQQLNSLRQEIKTISSNLEEKIRTMKSLNTVNEGLRIDLYNQKIRSDDTIRVLREENAKLKQNFNSNSNGPDNQQQLNALRQQIKTISSNLEEKIRTIQSLHTVNEVLRTDLSNQTISSEDTIRILMEENERLKQNFTGNFNRNKNNDKNTLDNLRLQSLEFQIQNYKLDIVKKNQTIRQLSDNITVLEADLTFERNRTIQRSDNSYNHNDVESDAIYEPRSRNPFKSCCTIM